MNDGCAIHPYRSESPFRKKKEREKGGGGEKKNTKSGRVAELVAGKKAGKKREKVRTRNMSQDQRHGLSPDHENKRGASAWAGYRKHLKRERRLGRPPGPWNQGRVGGGGGKKIARLEKGRKNAGTLKSRRRSAVRGQNHGQRKGIKVRGPKPELRGPLVLSLHGRNKKGGVAPGRQTGPVLELENQGKTKKNKTWGLQGELAAWRLQNAGKNLDLTGLSPRLQKTLCADYPELESAYRPPSVKKEGSTRGPEKKPDLEP